MTQPLPPYADFQRFVHGGTMFPLDPESTNTLLRDADPTLFYMLEYYEAVLRIHLNDAFMERVSRANADQIASIVESTVSFNPEPHLQENGLRFPLLSVHRKQGSFEYAGQRKLQVDALDVTYVLPPMQVSEAEQLFPILRAVVAVIDNRTEQGFDPAYTPSSPPGTAGELVWARARAGLCRVEMVGVEYGGYAPSPDVFFPAVIMSFTLKERSEALPTDLKKFAGVDVVIDSVDNDDGTKVDAIVNAPLFETPTIASLNVVTGTKAGGTAVILTGTGFLTGRAYRVLFGGSDASSVIATSTTTLSCLTPEFAAYPTQAVDVDIIDAFGQASNTLTNAFTFTSP